MAVMVLSVFGLAGCGENSSKYTEAEHIQRISERIQTRYINGNGALRYEVRPTDFAVYPLYDESDELKYFLVEFEPYGFLYIILNEKYSSLGSKFGGVGSMYTLSDTEGELSWSRYSIDETNSQSPPDTDKIWDVDGNGEKIIYYKSPYNVAGIENERRYCLREVGSTDANYVLASKEDDKFKNLISMQEVVILHGKYTNKQAVAYISFIPKGKFDL
jgi:hypothetical protein